MALQDISGKNLFMNDVARSFKGEEGKENLKSKGINVLLTFHDIGLNRKHWFNRLLSTTDAKGSIFYRWGKIIVHFCMGSANYYCN